MMHKTRYNLNYSIFSSLTLLLSTIFLIMLSGCSKEQKENVVFVSVEPQRALIEEIAGGRFDVETMLTSGSNPETFEPGMASRQRLEKAKAYFSTGHLPFEKKLQNSVKDINFKFYDVSLGIEPVYGTHEHHHADGSSHSHKGEADPHVWTSVRNARIMAKNMLDALSEIDPEGTDIFAENYQNLVARLDSLDKSFTDRLSNPSASKSFAIWHPSLSYFARDYGLEQVSVGFENKDMPAVTLQRIINEARGDSVRVFFFQKEFDSRQAATLNKELGTELVTINPLDYEWESQLDNIVSQLCR